MAFNHLSILLSLAIAGSSGTVWAEGDPKETSQAYPGAEKPSCLAQPVLKEYSEAFKKGMEKAQIALKKSFESPDGIWNQNILKEKAALKEALQDFMNGKKGQSVKNLKLLNRKPEEIHTQLIAAGFKHERLPLSAWNSDKNDKSRKFWRRDGTQTRDEKDPQLVPLDIYSHPDGGLVRVKPEGVPSLKHPHPEPEASKAVVYKTDRKEGQSGTLFDTRYRNEAFKVSEDGLPLPKSVTAKVGMRFIMDRQEIAKMKDPEAARQELKGWVTTIMRAAYLPLAADFSQCPKAELKEATADKKS